MALLASSWLLVESFIIPHGFLKWFYLSFYIHPFFLFFCQVFLWLKVLMNLLITLFYPIKVAFRLSLFMFRSIHRVVLFLFSYFRSTKIDVFYDALEPPAADCTQILITLEHSQVVGSCKKSTLSSSSQAVYRDRVESGRVRTFLYPNIDIYEEATEGINEGSTSCCVEDSWLNQYLYSDEYYGSSAIIRDDVDMSESMPSEVLLDQQERTSSSFRFSFMDQDSVNSKASAPLLRLEENTLAISQNDSVSPLPSFDFHHGTDLVGKGFPPSKQQQQQQQQKLIVREDVYAFHQKYTSRLRFFNVLYHERLHGINVMLNEHLSTTNVFNCIEQSRDWSMQWSIRARKRVLKSLECDLGMICVAQCCLFWEAIDYQYHKVECICLCDEDADSGNGNTILFHRDISGKFQEIEIMLQRFVEDERCECKGSSTNTNTSKRLSFQSLLQVPDVTGFVTIMEEETKMMKMKEEYCIRPTQLLEAMDNCIKAFWSYINADEKKSYWKYKSIWRLQPPVEDPRDLELLYHVMKILQKKGVMLRGVEGKSKCWMRRKVKVIEAESEKRKLLVSMIDVKLVQRVLKLSLISGSHLKWCQEKLDNIDFEQGTISRGCLDHLFPSP